MPTTTKNIWDYAAAKVANKSFMTRVGHSARFHGVRSAVNSKGSLGSKVLGGLGALGRASFNLIPLPIIGSLLTSAEQAIEGKLRAWHHDRNKGKAGVTQADYVKFALKEVSVANLDRYRYKVTDSVAEMTRVGELYVKNIDNSFSSGARCAANLEVALAIAQAERRIERFTTEVTNLKIVLDASIAWVEGATRSVTDYKEQVRQCLLKQEAREGEFIAQHSGTAQQKAGLVAHMKFVHADCGDFCVQKDNVLNGTWETFRAGAAAAVRELTTPFSPETFMVADRTSFENDSRVKNYGKAPPPSS